MTPPTKKHDLMEEHNQWVAWSYERSRLLESIADAAGKVVDSAATAIPVVQVGLEEFQALRDAVGAYAELGDNPGPYKE